MKKRHEEWLDEFLNSCRLLNKSEHTIINYRADLLKFITWYENNFQGLLNKAHGQTISAYKEFISGNHHYKKILEQNKAKKAKAEEKKTSKGKKLLEKVSTFFGIFKGKKEAKSAKIKAQKKSSTPHELVQKVENATPGFHLSVSSKRRHLSTIKNFYEFLKQSYEDTQENLFKNNPVKSKIHAIKLKEEDVVPTKLLTPKDWSVLKKSVYKPRDRLILHLLYFGGLRLHELCYLEIKNFDFSARSLTFRRKGGYIHKLFIQNDKEIFKLVELYLRAEMLNSEFLFPGKKEKNISERTMYNQIMKIIKKADPPSKGLTPHSFRKACATNLYQKCHDLLFVRDYLNHNDAKVTQTYIELRRSDIEDHLKSNNNNSNKFTNAPNLNN